MPSGRGYQPHLTLARCRAPADVNPLVGALGGFAGTPWVATEVHLIHSRLGARPRYASGRGYQPHLTLARCRAPADVNPLVGALGGFAGTPWVATEVHLIHSRLGARPRYEVIGTWPLRNALGS